MKTIHNRQRSEDRDLPEEVVDAGVNSLHRNIHQAKKTSRREFLSFFNKAGIVTGAVSIGLLKPKDVLAFDSGLFMPYSKRTGPASRPVTIDGPEGQKITFTLLELEADPEKMLKKKVRTDTKPWELDEGDECNYYMGQVGRPELQYPYICIILQPNKGDPTIYVKVIARRYNDGIFVEENVVNPHYASSLIPKAPPSQQRPGPNGEIITIVRSLQTDDIRRALVKEVLKYVREVQSWGQQLEVQVVYAVEK